MRKIVSLLFLIQFPFILAGQTNAVIERMRKERAQMEEQIARQEKILTNTENDMASVVSNLNIISAKLKERTDILVRTHNEVLALDRESTRLNREIEKLEKEHRECKDRYAEACKFFQRQNSNFNPLTFILASETFQEMRRRTRYIGEYSGSLYEMAHELAQKRDTLSDRREQVEMLKLEKEELQKIQQENEAAVRLEEKNLKNAVNKLKNQRNKLRKEIADQQKKRDQLSKEIDNQISKAIKEEQEKRKAAPVSAQKEQEDVKLSGSFESNKGKLPMPITGAYLVVAEYGVHNVAGMKDVKQNNLGLEIQGQKGAQARAVFDGVVSQIFQQGKGQIGVLVRHGSYISVYCNLSDTRLKKDDKVKTQDVIGNIQPSENGLPVLHFQLHKESKRLNPSDWLHR